MNKKKVYLLLFLILLLGTFLRLYKIGSESFWIDESATFYSSQQSPSYIVKNLYTKTILVPEYFKQGGGMPLYSLLSYYWTQMFGLSEFKLRLLPALFGILSIYVIFLIGKEIFNNKIGLVTAFILTINHQHIYYSQEARMYSLTVLLTLLSVYFLIMALLKNKDIYWFGYVTSTILLLYTHYYGFFILFFEYFYLLVFWKEHLRFIKQIAISSFGILILYLPWVPSLIRQIYNSPDIGTIIGKPTIFNLAQVFLSFNSWISPNFETRTALRNFNISQIPISGWILIVSVLLIALLLSLLFIIGLVRYNSGINFKNLKNKKYIFLLMWLLIPILVPFIISLIFTKSSIFGHTQYLLYVSPAYYLIVAKGSFYIKKYQKIFLIFLIIFSIVPIYSYYINFDKGQYREAASYFLQNVKENEFIFIHKPNIILPFSYYYNNLNNVKSIENTDELKTLVKGKNNFWIMFSMEKYSDPKGTIKDYLDTNFKSDKQLELVDVKIFHYVKAQSYQT